MVELFAHLKQGRNRLARYGLVAMDDASERTWRAGYALYRGLTQQTFGRERGSISEDDRKTITAQARAWLQSHSDEEN